MPKFTFGLIAVAIVALPNCSPRAQMATEPLIPIGQSPGLSSVSTTIGEIATADPATGTLSLAWPGGELVVQVTDETRIWLDRSQQRQPSAAGSFSDLNAGHRVEVKFLDETRRRTADWIKVAPQGSE